MATGKTKVDYALLLGETPVVFVEAKPARSTLGDDSVEQLRSYMRQELDVDWGVVTNGRSFEILTKGDDRRQEEVSLIEFDLDDLQERPELIEIISKEAIQSGKSDKIGAQIAQTNEAIQHLENHKSAVADRLSNAVMDEIGTSVPIDLQAQTMEFVDDLASALKEQRRVIGTSSSSDEQTQTNPESSFPEPSPETHVAILKNGKSALTTISSENQSDVMAGVTNYLIENHDLISEIQPLPYVPGTKRALINTEPTHPADGEQMRTYRELTNGTYLHTTFDKRTKKHHLQRLAKKCDVELEFDGSW